MNEAEIAAFLTNPFFISGIICALTLGMLKYIDRK